MQSDPSPEREKVAGEVRAIAARKKMLQTVIARELGMSQQKLSRRWTGEIPFDIDELFAIARVLGVAVTDLLPPPPMGGSGERVRQPTQPKVTAPKVRRVSRKSPICLLQPIAA